MTGPGPLKCGLGITAENPFVTRSDAAKIVDRAQRSGSLRADFTGEDLALTFGAIVQLAGVGSVALLLDGLRRGAAHQPLPQALLSPDQIFAVLGRLHGKS